MGYGSLCQTLRVSNLPEGIRMARTEFKFNIPSSGSWWPSIDSKWSKNSCGASPKCSPSFLRLLIVQSL